MRQRLIQMLKSDDGDDATDAIVQRFWLRAAPLAARGPAKTDGQVVDIAQWARLRGHIPHA